MRYEARQYCAFSSSKCRFISAAAASLAGCVFRIRTLPSILFRMVVMCPLHLAIFLEISGAVAFLHSLLMRLVVASDNVADAIFISLTCAALQRLSFQLRLRGRLLFTFAFWYFQFVLLTNLCPDAPCYVRRFLSKSEHRVSE